MKKFTSILLIAMALLMFESCEKEENVTPDDEQTEDPGGSVNEANVFGLNQNRVKADGVTEEELVNIRVEQIGDLYKLSATPANSSGMIEIYLKATEPKVGNYKLKKWRLGFDPAETEVYVRIGIAGTLLDFESGDSKNFSITKNAEGLFVFKMAPVVGIKKNSWDDELTAPISLHIVKNK